MFEDYASNVETVSAGQSHWFVYLLPLLDCTAFKIGFSCNPLRRFHSFSNRYFDRFDFLQAVLLRVATCDDARAIEAMLKGKFAEFRTDAPDWVPAEAGGHTEWFSAVYFPQAEEEVRSLAQENGFAKLIQTFDYITAELHRSAPYFEQWALHHAYRLRDDIVSVSLGYEAAVPSNLLRDWFDAFRFFKIPLFADDPEVLKFIAESIRR